MTTRIGRTNHNYSSRGTRNKHFRVINKWLKKSLRKKKRKSNRLNLKISTQSKIKSKIYLLTGARRTVRGALESRLSTVIKREANSKLCTFNRSKSKMKK